MKPAGRTGKRHQQPAGDDLWQWAESRVVTRPEAGPIAPPETTCEADGAGVRPVTRLTVFLDRCRARIQDPFGRRRTGR